MGASLRIKPDEARNGNDNRFVAGHKPIPRHLPLDAARQPKAATASFLALPLSTRAPGKSRAEGRSGAPNGAGELARTARYERTRPLQSEGG